MGAQLHGTAAQNQAMRKYSPTGNFHNFLHIDVINTEQPRFAKTIRDNDVRWLGRQ